jgi:NADH:ubiquinone oxidoreductase subunit 3 (subunit A)
MRMHRIAVAAVAIILVIAFTSVALLPLSTSDLGPRPQPMSTYESAIVAIGQPSRAFHITPIKPGRQRYR